MRPVVSSLIRVSALGLSLCLSGCMLGPDYVRPSIETSATFRFSEGAQSQIADTAWWEQFGDPVLNELISTALAQNKDLQIAAARVDEFRGQFVSTRSQLFPQVSAGFNAGRQRVSPLAQASLPPGVGTAYDSFNATLPISWELDVFGRVRRQTEAARASLFASEEGRRATILTLVSSVATSYINLRNLDQQLEIANATVASRAGSVKVFELRFRAGEISQVELAQSQSEYEASLAEVPAIEAQIGQQEDALSVLLGRNPGPVLRGRTLETLQAPNVPAALPSELLERRPDVLQAEQNLIAANALIGAARALYFPQISLTGLFGSTSTQLAKLFSGPANTWSFAGALTAPIFTAGNIAGQVNQAQAQQQEALFSYQKTIQSAFQEVSDALIGVQKSRERLAAQQRQVDALIAYSKLARARYEGGYTSYMEVLDAERSLFNAQLGYTQTRSNEYISLVTLYKAMGGGWGVDTPAGSRPGGDVAQAFEGAASQ
ncbi:efflux transporter outer membrane subunit [Paraburkholderia caffeinilytica]|uniref:RND transporter n=1 Tax=Paraburkholderia caffeinilytica TaxID=1761016 RepID=A0ABQ1MY23_9BURK|nr:efflux transporter outer membrane subunit [Paraburkholderia caffeinilytica]GGC46879.1 RND transporter [Paraburkholderia caffeinilytica]CAB3783336.1 Outer membrane protein OprM [Paraburkholderia caffeinilytica]